MPATVRDGHAYKEPFDVMKVGRDRSVPPDSCKIACEVKGALNRQSSHGYLLLYALKTLMHSVVLSIFLR